MQKTAAEKQPVKVKKSPVVNKPEKSKKKHQEQRDKSESESEEVDEEMLFKICESKPKPDESQMDFIQSLEPEELKLFNELYTACSTNNAAMLNELLTNQDSQLVKKLVNKRLSKEKGHTLLHMSSELGNADCLWLLLSNGADPAMSDLSKLRRLPYEISLNKPTKDQYRRFMHDFPDLYDYTAAKVGAPLSEEQMNSKAEKEKEKKRLQKLKKKQRDSDQKQREKNDEIEMAERQRFLSLTDQEKRMLIIDRNFLNVAPLVDKKEYESKLTKEQAERLLVIEKRRQFFDKKQQETAQAAAIEPQASKVKFSPQELKVISRCWYCGVDMSTHVPFEYFDYKFCSSKCLKAHRDQKSQPK